MPYCKLKQFDYNRNFNYHSTIAMNLERNLFERIKRYIHQKEPPNYKEFILRVTLLKESKILCEYDFLLRRALTRREAKDKHIYAQTINLLKEFFAGRYNPNKFLGNIPQPKIQPDIIPIHVSPRLYSDHLRHDSKRNFKPQSKSINLLKLVLFTLLVALILGVAAYLFLRYLRT